VLTDQVELIPGDRAAAQKEKGQVKDLAITFCLERETGFEASATDLSAGLPGPP